MANPRNLAKIAPIVSAASGKLLLTDTATLNGGTANSLVYLNANKEATTVSTLFFDGTRVGINTTTPGSILDVKGVLRLTGASTGFVGLQAATSGSGVTYTLPASDGLNGQVLQTNGVGSLSWTNQTGGGGGGSSGSGTSTSRTAFTATEGQTTFSVNYVVGQVDVYLNGSKLIANNDFTATSGNTVVLAVGATAGSVVEAVVYSSQWITSSTNLYYTGGNIGVGTSSPAALVHAASANTAFAVGTIRIDGADSAGTVNAPVTINAATGGATGNGGSQLYFSTRADGGSLTERLRIDHRGNIGLGVVPSAWTWNSPASGSVVDIGSVGSIFSLAGEVGVGTEVTRNVYYSGTSWIHKTEGAASRFEQSGGTFRWFSAPFALTGNTAVFTEYMRLTADGRLGIGRTNPVRPLDVAGAYVSDGGANTIVRLQSTNEYNSFPSSGISFSNKYDSSGNTAGMGSIAVLKENATDGDFAGALALYTRPSGGAVTERVRIDSNGNVGIGTSSPARSLDVLSTANGVATFKNSTAAAFSEISVSSNDRNFAMGQRSSTYAGGDLAYFYSATATPIAFFNNTQERMRIDASGNLGLGVAPSAWTSYKALQISTGVSLASTANQMVLGSNWSFDGSDRYVISDFSTLYIQNSGQHKWFTAPSGSAGANVSFTQVMTLDASGNLGINNTSPSSFGKVVVQVAGTTTPTNATNVGPSSINLYSAGNGGSTNCTTGIFGWNAFEPGVGSGIGFVRESDSNWGTQIRLYTHPADVANIGDITERARITSGGQALFGETTENLSRWGRALFNYPCGTSNPVIGLRNSTARATNNLYGIVFSDNTDETNAAVYVRQTGTNNAADLLFGTNAGTGGATLSSVTERARITSGGYMGIGGVPVAPLHVLTTTRSLSLASPASGGGGASYIILGNNDSGGTAGPSMIASSNRNIQFGVGNSFSSDVGGTFTEYARITSGGYFKASNNGIYNDAAGSYHELRTNGGNNVALLITHTGTSGQQYGVQVSTANDQNDATRYFLSCNGGATLRASIYSNGGIANYSGNDVSLSDRREKTNFAPAKSYLNTICAIPVQTFEYIDQSPNDPGLTLGVVAQDVQAVAPELVHESNWGTEEEPKMRLGIYQTDMQYALMKCIQEQQALITELQAEIAAIKAKLPE